MHRRNFNYPINLRKAKEGGYVITFPDLPEAITQSDSRDDAFHEAVDCLEEAIANRMAMKLDIPKPSFMKKNQLLIPLHGTLAAKVALYISLREKKLSNVAFAKKLHCNEKEIRRLLDPYYSSKFSQLEFALEKLGSRLSIELSRC